MKQMRIGSSSLQASVIGLGCMRMCDLEVAQARRAIVAAQDAGINFFDHADVYGDGLSEQIFSKAVGMNPAVREGMLIQSKCGIRKDGVVRYDFSKAYILSSVDGILKRLGTEYLDILLLHRPDALVEPEEVAAAFDQLHTSGKVRHFGVSNQSPRLMDLLAQSLNQPILVNQIQLSLAHSKALDHQIYFNTDQPQAISRESEVLEYCRLKGITLQAWSPFQYVFFQGRLIGYAQYAPLNDALAQLAQARSADVSAIVLAWLLRHPAGIQPIVGSMNPDRIAQMCAGADIALSREEWYQLYSAAGNALP